MSDSKPSTPQAARRLKQEENEVESQEESEAQRIARNQWTFIVACLLSLALLLGAYSNHFHNDFQYDDIHVITKNLYLRNLTHIPQFFVDARTFSSLPTNATYRPLLSVSFAVDYWLAGKLDPWQFHVTQFTMLLVLGMGLICLFLRIMNLAAEHEWNRYAALFAALFFCLHTANTETVNYISARSDLLSTLGVVSAFLVYLFLPRSRRYHLYLIPMVLGAFVKIPAIMFAPLLLVFVLFFEEKLSCADLFSSKSWPQLRAAIRRIWPAFLVGLILFWFLEAMNAPHVDYGNSVPRLHYLWTQAFVWVHYVRLFFVPVGLTANTDWRAMESWYDAHFFAGVLLLMLLLCVIWSSSRKQELRPVGFGIVWFGIALLPTSSIFPLHEVFNEHRIFFPYIGLSLALVWWLGLQAHRLWQKQPGWRTLILGASCVVALLILSAHAVGTYHRNTVWRSAETLWRDTVQKSPKNGGAWNSLAIEHIKRRRYLEAKPLLEKGLSHWPNYPRMVANLGLVQANLGDPASAEKNFIRALQLNPVDGNNLFMYALWLKEQGRSPEAIPHLQKAIAHAPAKSGPRTELLNLYAAMGAEAELERLAHETLDRFPDHRIAAVYARRKNAADIKASNVENYHKRGERLMTQSRYLRAAIVYQQVVNLDPESAEAYNNLGSSLMKLGFHPEAAHAFETALRLRPDFAEARKHLDDLKSRTVGK